MAVGKDAHKKPAAMLIKTAVSDVICFPFSKMFRPSF